jgi:hypothetical protein
MRRVDLDFRKTRARSNTATGLLLLLTGLLSAAWIVDTYNSAKIEQQRIKSELAQSAKPQDSPLGNIDQEAKQQLQQASSVIEQLSFPWNKLFQAIEENSGEDMALLSIQPDLAARTVMLDAESRNWSGMVSYIKRLEEDRFFSNVHVVSHQTQQSDPQRPVRFKLSCTWVTSLDSASSPSPTVAQQEKDIDKN